MTERKIERPVKAALYRDEHEGSCYELLDRNDTPIVSLLDEPEARELELCVNAFPKLVAALREAQEEIHEAFLRGQITPSAARIADIQARDELLRSLEPSAREEEPKS